MEVKKENIFVTIEKLKEKYPDEESITKIEEQAEQIRQTLKKSGFSQLDTTQELIRMCKRDVNTARRKLATDKTLMGDEKAQRELWSLIDSRMWFLQLVSGDFEAELASMADALERDLAS